MKQCKTCGNDIPYSVRIDGIVRIMKNRINCINCIPYGKSRYVTKTEEGRLKRAAANTRRYYHRQKEKNGTGPTAARRLGYKNLLIKYCGWCCQLCSYSRCVRNLCFHHLRDKQFSLDMRRMQYELSKIYEEVCKCVLVCHNCHGEIHDGLIDLQTIEKLNIELQNKTKILKGKCWIDLKSDDIQAK